VVEVLEQNEDRAVVYYKSAIRPFLARTKNKRIEAADVKNYYTLKHEWARNALVFSIAKQYEVFKKHLPEKSFQIIMIDSLGADATIEQLRELYFKLKEVTGKDYRIEIWDPTANLDEHKVLKFD
jgi:ASC-1-like (ASCH) protein